MPEHVHRWLIASPGSVPGPVLPASCACGAERTYPAAGPVERGETWNASKARLLTAYRDTRDTHRLADDAPDLT